ncbi:Gfo/Idh/MocA family protein [Dickeya oryzae]
MKKNYGILSTASIVPRFVSAVRASGDGTVLAIASRSAEKARAKAGQLGIERAYGSYQALMDDKDVNIVYIATINSEHYTNCLMALEHGKHVICEKPFVLKKQEAEHLFRLATERGGVYHGGPEGGIPSRDGSNKGHPAERPPGPGPSGRYDQLLRGDLQ